uniref:Uncharacterized protein n=1 Tax=Anguilla anguilla TaxID=7936 RepID=A0A0E9W1T4_ANGAN
MGGKGTTSCDLGGGGQVWPQAGTGFAGVTFIYIY